MEVDKKAVFPSVLSGNSEQLHPSFMWWEENFTWRFTTFPSEEHAGSGWVRTVARKTCRETTHCFCEHWKTGRQFQ